MSEEKIDLEQCTNGVKVVRSVRHSLLSANKRKRRVLADFLNEYRYVVYLYVDFLWSATLDFGDGKLFDIRREQYNLPKMLSNVFIESMMDERIRKSPLSARAKACALSQSIGMVRASIEKARRFQYVISTKFNGKMTKGQFVKKEQKRPRKPHCDNIRAELRSLCAIVDDNCNRNSKFDYVIRLKSLGDKYGSLTIPIKKTKCDSKFLDDGFVRLNGFLISYTDVDFRYSKNIVERHDGIVIGCDQGMKDTLTLSNGMTTPTMDNQGKTADMLYHKLARKKKGSMAFKRAEIELTNFINWQVKQTVSRLNGVKAINLEKVQNIRFRKASSRLMSHWSNPHIVDALRRNCEISGVHVHEEASTYMSQRCSNCGLVRKANRKGKVYKCPHCGHETDADLNAAINHTVGLPPIDWRFRKLNLNRGKGFFWMTDGLYSRDGEGEPGVHLDPITGIPMEDFS